MKLFITIAINFIFVSLLSAQHTEEFTLTLSQGKVLFKAGERKDISLTLQRSKSYTNVNASIGLASDLPEGIHVTFEPDSGVMSNSTAHISVDENVKPGSHVIVINCTMNHKNKGVMLKVVIEDNAVTLK